MKKIFKKIVVVILILFLLMQLYQPSPNLDYGKVLPQNFTKLYYVPMNVQTILKTSCYDCHSNNTNYPWYSNLQPIRFFMDGHINEGKENLNFSEFGNYSRRKKENKLDRIIKQIKSDEMPLNSYTLIHKNAKLTDENKIVLINWMQEIKDSISVKN
jgi:hypothetical protein